MKTSLSFILNSSANGALARAAKSGKLRIILSCAVALIVLACASVPALATSYSWTAGGGSWSNTTNWTPSASTGGPGSADIANLNDLTATTSGTYDLSASGTLGALNVTQNVASSVVNTYLVLGQNLTLLSGSSNIYSTQGNGSSTGLAQIDLGNNNLIIGSAGGATSSNSIFTIGSLALTNVKTFGNATNIITNASTSGSTSVGAGGVTINGTLVVANANTGGNTFNIIAPVTLAGGADAAHQAVILFNDTVSAGNTDRLVIQGNFTSTGNTLISGTGLGASSEGIFFEGTNVNIGAGTVISGFAGSGAAFTFANNGSVVTNQTISLGSLVLGMSLRTSGYSGTVGSPVTSIRTIASTGTSGAVNNAINTINMDVRTTSFMTQLVPLASNLNLAAGQASPFTFSLTATGTGERVNIDLAGFAYDATASLGTVAFNPAAGTTAGVNQINILNSGASSITGTNGMFKAAFFKLAPNDIGIGNGVILQASNTGVSGTNNLGVMTSGVTTISPNSTFYFTGSGTGSLTSNRAIGRLQVGNGVAASNLGLATADLTVGGDVTISSNGILDLNGFNLTEAGGTGATSGGLNGAGTIQSTTGTPTVTLDTTGGNGIFSGAITNGSGTVAVTKAGTGTQTFSSTSSYTGATAVNGGKLIVSGSLNGTASVTVAAAAELQVNGLLNALASVSVSGTLSGDGSLGAVTLSSGASATPGSSGISNTGILTTGMLTENSGAHLTMEINGTTAGLSADQLITTGVSLAGDLKLTIGYAPGSADTLTLILNGTGAVAGGGFSNVFVTDTNGQTNASYSGAPNTIITLNGQQFTLSYTGGDGNDVTLAAVPEPQTWAMLVGGVGMLAFWQRTRRRISHLG